MNNIVIVNQSGSKYLFSVPESIQLKEGDKVKCDTARGVTDGVCFTDSTVINTSALPLICKLTGAKLPLKEVVGKTVTEVQMFDKPVEEPTQTAQAEKAESKFKAGDRVKIVGNHNLHCYKIGEIVTLEGKRQHHDSVDLYYWDTGKSCGYVREQDIEPYTEPTPTLTVTRDTLVKLGACSDGLAEFDRKFPSGEGEFETVVNATGEGNRIWLNRNKSCIEAMQNEPKKVEPTYLNMKVVCVSSSDRDFTVGKVYEFKNGQALDNTNVNRPTCERLKSLDDNYLKHWSYKFIEYKGEQS